MAMSRALGAAAALSDAWHAAEWESAEASVAPLNSVRRITSQTAFQAVQEMHPADPLRTPLSRWIYRLAEQRINHVALHAVGSARHDAKYEVLLPREKRHSIQEMLHRALRAPDQNKLWMNSLLQHTAQCHHAVSLLWQRRWEIARRLGLGSPSEIEVPGEPVRALAEEWLRITQDVAEEFRREHVADVVELALARDAAQGWPTHLTVRNLLDYFRDTTLFAELPIHVARLPAPLAAASYLRALRSIGSSWARVSAPGSQPFVVRRDPYALWENTAAHLFALLPLNETFAQKRMQVGESAWSKQRRGLARAVLLESRALALRVLLREPALKGRAALGEAHAELAERAFGCHLRPESAGVLWQLDVTDSSAFAGLLLAAAHMERLIEAHDEDWFRNPRGVDQLRSEAGLPPQVDAPEDALRAGATALRRELESVLA